MNPQGPPSGWEFLQGLDFSPAEVVPPPLTLRHEERVWPPVLETDDVPVEEVMTALRREGKTCVEQLRAFLRRDAPNEWLADAEMRVYVRKGVHAIGGRLRRTLDVADIEVFEPGEGKGTRFINQAHRLHRFEATYVENLLNRRFMEHMLREGWLVVPESKDAPTWSLYKLRRGHPRLRAPSRQPPPLIYIS